MSEYQLGSELQWKDKTWRIVRVLTMDRSLFEDEGGTFVIVESYVQLKAVDGEIDHIIVSSDKLPYDGPPSTIKALKPLARSNNG